ncbi:MAG: 2-dehydropantoate 2-reductase [Pseudomonadota bacterium]
MTRIAVAGAGAIGCFVGGLLAAQGHDVRFMARGATLDDLQRGPLHLTDYAGLDAHVPVTEASDDPAILEGAEVVLVTCKTAATAQIAADIKRFAPVSAPILSLQNGLEAVDALRTALADRDVRAAMVPFNVVRPGPNHFHRATSGDILVQDGPMPDLAAKALIFETHPDIRGVQYGKLLINLNNAPNALADIPILDQLQDRAWRRLLADQMAEALRVLNAAGITPAKTTAAPPALIPHILRLPTPLFRRVAAQMLTIDPSARASMWDDLTQRRMTEIGALQGHIIALGAAHGVPTPINSAIAAAVAAAEAAAGGPPGLGPEDLRP